MKPRPPALGGAEEGLIYPGGWGRFMGRLEIKNVGIDPDDLLENLAAYKALP